jgi:hypothetical protein
MESVPIFGGEFGSGDTLRDTALAVGDDVMEVLVAGAACQLLAPNLASVSGRC